MTAHRILNTMLAAFVIAAWMFLAANFDREAGEQDTSAQAVAAEAQRFERAARAICGGENANVELLANGSVQCRTKRGAKTITAQVQL